MSATRFYFSGTDGDNPVSPAFDSNWEQTGEATRRKLYYKPTLSVTTPLGNKQVTVPITTTQDILCCQFVSDPIPAQLILGTFSYIVRCSENALTNNAFSKLSIRVCSQDGTVIRGTLFSINSFDSEFPTTAATRGAGTQALTSLVTQPGDRLVIEMGVGTSAPSGSGSAIKRFGSAGASDFALSSGLTTDLNPWIEFSQDLFNIDNNNYKFVKSVSAGIISVTEKIR